MSLDAGERIYAADVDYPMMVVGTAGRGLIIYTLEGQPKEYKRIEPPLKYQHRCLSIFKDKKASPVGTFEKSFYWENPFIGNAENLPRQLWLVPKDYKSFRPWLSNFSISKNSFEPS